MFDAVIKKIRLWKFNPLRDIPRNDGEALKALARPHQGITTSLQGIYQTWRGEGESVLAAYRKTLETELTHAIPGDGGGDREAA